MLGCSPLSVLAVGCRLEGMVVRGRAMDGQNGMRDILWGVEVVVEVVVVVVDQLLHLCGELLARYRLVLAGRGPLGVILLTTAPDHPEVEVLQGRETMRGETKQQDSVIWYDSAGCAVKQRECVCLCERERKDSEEKEGKSRGGVGNA